MLRVQGKGWICASPPCPHPGANRWSCVSSTAKAWCSTSTLGFTDEFLPQFEKVLELPHGILLVTGPTGSGKTTTLYTALSRLNTPGRQDHHGRRPGRVPDRGHQPDPGQAADRLDFSHALRSIVRQDPDIIMIGEMRDLETAKIAIQSALTGHLVLHPAPTTPPGGITRLLDMGVEDYLLTSTVNGMLPSAGAAAWTRPAPNPGAAEVIARIRPGALHPGVADPAGASPCRRPGTTLPATVAPRSWNSLVMSDPLRRSHHAARRHGRDRNRRARRHAHHVRGRAGQVGAGVTTIEEVLRVTQES